MKLKILITLVVIALVAGCAKEAPVPAGPADAAEPESDYGESVPAEDVQPEEAPPETDYDESISPEDIPGEQDPPETDYGEPITPEEAGITGAATQPVTTVTPEETGPTVINMKAMQWRFDPQEIVVNEGDSVELTIESIDVRHGFSLPEFGVNEVLKPGSEVVINFVADKKGVFPFACSVTCGSGHSGMTGTLVVQ